MEVDVDAWFAELDSLRQLHGDFLPEGRPKQPPMPESVADRDEEFGDTALGQVRPGAQKA